DGETFVAGSTFEGDRGEGLDGCVQLRRGGIGRGTGRQPDHATEGPEPFELLVARITWFRGGVIAPATVAVDHQERAGPRTVVLEPMEDVGPGRGVEMGEIDDRPRSTLPARGQLREPGQDGAAHHGEAAVIPGRVRPGHQTGGTVDELEDADPALE